MLYSVRHMIEDPLKKKPSLPPLLDYLTICFICTINNKNLTKKPKKQRIRIRKGKEMFYLTTHSTHFIYGYMASDIWQRTTQIVREETRCRHMGYSFRLTARVILYAPSHRQDSTYHGLCYPSRGALAGTRNSSMGPPINDRSDDPSHKNAATNNITPNKYQTFLTSTPWIYISLLL